MDLAEQLFPLYHIFEVIADSDDTTMLEGIYVVDPKIDSQFKERFQRRFNRYPILEAYSGYEAMRSVAFAAKRRREAPQKAMKDVVYQGVAGPIDYSGTSCAGNQSDWGLFQIRGGIPIEQQ